MVARAAGVSAWQFIAPALIVALVLGVVATTIYNPIAANLRERRSASRPSCSARAAASAAPAAASGCASAATTASRSSMPQTAASRAACWAASPSSAFDSAAASAIASRRRRATLEAGYWRLEEARIYRQRRAAERARDLRAQHQPDAASRSRESFATPETVPFWQLSSYIDSPRMPASPPPAIACSTISCWRSRSCSRPWCCWPRRSACASSASAACRRWCWAASRRAFCSTCCRRSPTT